MSLLTILKMMVGNYEWDCCRHCFCPEGEQIGHDEDCTLCLDEED